MREFIVILRSGVRFTVKAQRIVVAHPHLVLDLSDGPHVGDPGTSDAVAMFTGHEVLAVVSREHLVSEEKKDQIAGPHIVGPDDPIPF